ncbi:MAG: efflux RND transporter periplasmic adaptor subunit [Rhizobiaceae bacterium]|nr:efflux RND transporter periplasmic adaptor subunit [Hyphomicrobiales bacterium]NRB31682.1 efflux RND transporter periplasmic adaptor subunit [Rhizobiaceae bacterium]
MKLRGSHLVSLAILAGIGGWMFTGELIEGGQADPNAETIADRQAKLTNNAFRVRIVELQPSERTRTLSIRGRTQAESMVSVRAETGGTVETRAVEKGQMVKPGDLLCVIDKGVRQTQLDQAKAVLRQAQEDYDANKLLVERGFATNTKLRGLKAALDTAVAQLATAEQDMSRTEVRATVSGQVQTPYAEVGDNLRTGDVCVTLMETNPMLFSGQVPEREIGAIKPGMSASVNLISGDTVGGTIRYISPVADANTRTFNIEIEMPNPERKLLDGMTATADIDLDPIKAYQINPSWLTLADDGQIGVRSVSTQNKVQFNPVKIIAMDEKQAWVDGLNPGLRVITLGQNFVAAGEEVEPLTQQQMEALEKAAASGQMETKS